jgi:hypothetical protein
MADTPKWEPVTGAGGAVLGWMSPADPGEPDVDYFEADRLARVRRRADILDQAVTLMGPEFDLDATWEALEAALPEDDIVAAARVVLMLEKIERGLEC